MKAYVLPRPDAEISPADLVYWCAEHLAYFKVPRYIEMRDDLPRTPSLRVRKDVLRQERENPLDGCFDREAAGIRLRKWRIIRQREIAQKQVLASSQGARHG